MFHIKSSGCGTLSSQKPASRVRASEESIVRSRSDGNPLKLAVDPGGGFGDTSG